MATLLFHSVYLEQEAAGQVLVSSILEVFNFFTTVSVIETGMGAYHSPTTDMPASMPRPISNGLTLAGGGNLP